MDCFRQKTFILLLSVLIFLPVMAFGGPGRTGAGILNRGGGARAAALGDAFSAISGDVTASLWNPSGLANMPQSILRPGRTGWQGYMSYRDYGVLFGEGFNEIYDAIIAGAIPVEDMGTLGATLQMQEQGTISVPDGSFDRWREVDLGTNFVMTFSYANRITESLSAGINGKLIRMVLGDVSGSSYALDLGAQYRLALDSIPTTLGVVIQNVGPGISFSDEGHADPLPRFLRLGTSIRLYEDKYNHVRFVSGITAYIDKLTEDETELAIDLERLNAEREEKLTREQLLSDRGIGIRAFEWRHLQKNLGLECWFANALALRVGYKSEPGMNNSTDLVNDLADRLTYGVSVRFYLFNVDLAYGPRPGRKRLLEVTTAVIF